MHMIIFSLQQHTTEYAGADEIDDGDNFIQYVDEEKRFKLLIPSVWKIESKPGSTFYCKVPLHHCFFE